MLLATQDQELFLKGIEALLEYPLDVRVDLDDDVATQLLKVDSPRERILVIYEKWIARLNTVGYLLFRNKSVHTVLFHPGSPWSLPIKKSPFNQLFKKNPSKIKKK